ncbi:THAP domain-containing protein 1-like [Mizuhopecten yessoensis]|uniref:THAP domain-containing protein 1-like n=1 Tax=Mizuhopecten yessoensis TaxID=6573 RepID=UPI000B45ACF2|nr:THAP domain-containing protein 1-like [Mizuhopecten yessoensis]
MVHTCVVYGCHNRANDSTKRGFYGFHAIRLHEDKLTEELSRERRRKWIAVIGRKDFNPSTHSKVCSDHFVGGKPATLFEKTNPDWAPSLKLAGSKSIDGFSLKHPRGSPQSTCR